MRIHLIVSLAFLLFSVVASAQITVNTNFDPRTNQPIDIRDTLTFLADTSTVTWTYPGLVAYAADADQFWYYTGSFWKRVVQDPFFSNLQDVDTAGIDVDDIAQWDGSNWVMTSPGDVVSAGSDSTNSIYNLLPTQDVLIDPNANDLIIGSFGAGNSGDFEFFTTNEDGQYAGIFAGTRDSSWLATDGDGFQFDAAFFSTGAEDGVMGVNYEYFGTVWNAAVFGDSVLFAPYPGSELNMTINGLPDDPVNPYKVMVQDTLTDRVYLTSIDSLLGSGTAGTLPIWNADGTLGNSSVTESGGNVIGTSFTGAFGLATGTTAQAPVGANGLMRYNSTANGISAWNGSAAAWQYLPWAVSPTNTNNTILLGGGSTGLKESTWTISSATMTAPNNAFLVWNNNAGRMRWTTIPGAFIDGGQYGLRLYSGSTVHGAATTIENNSGIIATIGTLRGGSYGTAVSSIQGIGFSRISGMNHTGNIISGYEGSSSAGANSTGGNLSVIGGTSANSNWAAGDLILEGGKLGSSLSSLGGTPGDVIIGVYPDPDSASHISDNIRRNVHIYRGITYNWEWYQRKQTTSGIQTLTMESDTVKYRIENIGTISTSTDGSGDIVVAHGMGITPTVVTIQVEGTTYYGTTVHSKDATNFTVRFFDMSTTPPTPLASTAVTATWHAKT